MEYERIHKVQTGIISPSKLRMKLMGPHHQRKKDGSNSNSSRTSPSKLEDSEFVKNSLLALEDEASSLEVSSVKLPGDVMPDLAQGDQISCQPKESLPRENGSVGRVKTQQYSKCDTGNSSTIHPVRTLEEENLDYDSNASSSSFEFHKERSLHNSVSRSLSRPMPSKWNDAEKWIMNRQNAQANYTKKNVLQSQGNRLAGANMVRVAPESASTDHKLSVKRVDFCQPAAQMGLEKFSFVPNGAHPISAQANGGNALIDLCQTKDLKEVDPRELSCLKGSPEDTTGFSAIRAVSMRDMGTEMTPIPSQDPSRTATPVGATTPLRSPTSSLPSTPRRAGAPAPTPAEHMTDDESRDYRNRELSEEELKLKTRKEIVALGVQLGKMNIAAWASKDEKEKSAQSGETHDLEDHERIEYERRAAAWEEAEKSKHAARYKREEIKIQAWESQQKAKLEAEMRRIEAQVEQMRAHAQAKMVKKIAMARQRSEEKRAAAEANRNREAEKTSAQAEYIRQTGRIPTSQFVCCGWL
ncbi:hypothetical protein VitviT2T_015478 [Vitis vinifera]|uniref:Remorin C-terminal domain-containing protein n=2 Tax=Vitis vinifera TaxID=29760 RepID=A0ABY9CNK2_VITVI|eukprot:XP_002272255.1 PREDICTED: uncharacterized protein LOC100256651 isoform X1 [Vitis vinifera]